MPNIKTEINSHDGEILRNTPSKNAKQANCQQKENSPMNETSLKESLICYATISCSDKNYKPKPYKGSLRSAIIATKNHLTYPCTNMISNYQLSIGA